MATESSATTSALLWAGAAGAALFVVVALIEGALRPGHDPASMPVSALSLGDRGWVQIASFVLTGVCMLACATGVGMALPAEMPGRWWSVALFAVFGAGMIASGVFVMDPPPGVIGNGADSAADVVGVRTWHGAAHDVAGFVVFLSLAAGLLTLGASIAGAGWGDRIGLVSLATGAAVLVLFAAFVATSVAAPHVAGLVQRILIVVGWSGLAWTAAALARA